MQRRPRRKTIAANKRRKISDSKVTLTPTPERERRPWSDVHEDIMRSIMEKLYPADQIRFQAFCKDWPIPSSNSGTGPLQRMPWLSAYWWFQDSISGQQTPSKFSLSASFATRLAILPGEKNGNSLIMLKDVIKLPELSSKHVVVTISSAPTSQGCVLFVASLLSGNKLRISTRRCGDKAWSTQKFDGEFEKPQKSVVYFEGAFYCVFKGGMLGFFTVEDGSWSLLTTSLDPLPWWDEFDMYSAYLVECDGKLLMATVYETFEEWRFFRFDWSEMSWVLQERLGEWSLFAGGTSFLVPAVEGREYLAEKIYYKYFWHD
ncbi:unnamed protein product [Ilex paraguariensis]|uniref:KIB1-4 beta-propeller domain-containing protein n=1 Tax=Ilex paraguariensis TaxID=185542 RepID=A0ABC8UEQ0_9AQUA